MLIVFISFLYLGITSFLMGFGIKITVMKLFSYEIRDIFSIFFGGLGLATVYAGFFSLFHGVGLGANLLLCFFWHHTAKNIPNSNRHTFVGHI